MPPRATVEEFDDDTDLPLPTHLLPNTGARGALLEQIGVDYAAGRSDSDDDDAPPLIPAAASSTQSRAPGNMSMGGAPTQSRPGVVDVTDVTPFKKWTSVYPIYIDAKRPHGTTQRRIARTKAVWWPLSQDIADACRKLGLQILHEPQKMHPRDWENPGRVKVLLKKDGAHVHPIIRTKRQLIERIASTIQATKPELVPSANAGPAHKASGPPMSERVPPYTKVDLSVDLDAHHILSIGGRSALVTSTSSLHPRTDIKKLCPPFLALRDSTAHPLDTGNHSERH